MNIARYGMHLTVAVALMGAIAGCATRPELAPLAAGSDQWPGKIGSVRLVGGGKLKFTRNENGLHVFLPEKFNGKIAFALKIRS
jgi:hypothetical protein